MLSRYLKVLALVVVCLLGGNSLIWPRFYLSNLADPLRLAQTAWSTAPLRNLAAIIFLALVILSYYQLSSSGSRLLDYIDRFLDSIAYIILLWLVIGVAAARLFALSLTYDPDAPAKEHSVEESGFQAIAIPVDSVYLDVPRINAAYSQLQGSFTPTEKIVRTSKATETEAKADAGPVAASQAVAERGETETRFVADKARELTRSIELVNHLGTSGALVTVADLGADSKELARFDSALSLLKDSYQIEPPHEETAAARDKILSRILAEVELSRFRTSSWVLLKGPVAASTIDNEVHFVFDYLPSIPGRLQFKCQIPAASIAEASGGGFNAGGEWDLLLFGKIVRVVERGQSFRAELLCYSIFR